MKSRFVWKPSDILINGVAPTTASDIDISSMFGDFSSLTGNKNQEEISEPEPNRYQDMVNMMLKGFSFLDVNKEKESE